MSKQTNFPRKIALDNPDKKPSVFERLGSKSCVFSGKNICRSWAQNGTCPLNKSCKFAHTHVLISPSKRPKTETMKKSVVVHKKNKDDHKKSLRFHQGSEQEWEGWELGDLEDADEKVLEKRKQELQRELHLHLKKEKELTKKKDKKTEKKRAASTSSSSTTSTESSSTSTSTSSSSSEPRRRQNRKRKHASSSSESEVSPQRRKKSPKTVKGKVTAVKKNIEKKDSNRVVTEGKNKSVVVAKKSVVQKKSYSPSCEKSRARSPAKQQASKKSPAHHSPDTKNKSSSPHYDKTVMKNKSRGLSPKQKVKDTSPKRTIGKIKESSAHVKDKPRQSPCKARSSPLKSHKLSPIKSRRHDESSDKRRGHYEDRKHSPRKDRSREKDRKRDVRRGRSNDDDNGGLKKGGKILPLKPPSYNKDSGIKKDTTQHHKSSEKSSSLKSKEEDIEKDRSRMTDRERDRSEKERSKCERDRSKHKKGSDDHERRPVRERDADRCTVRGKDDRSRDREAERLRYAKEREAERQKERDEALERCRERQRERERLEKERKEKEDKKHQRDTSDNKSKDFERELPSLLDLKAENPARNHGDSTASKSFDKHLSRDCRRNLDKANEKSGTQDRDGRRGTPEKDHDRRDSRRSNDNDRRIGDKDYDNRRNREEARNLSEVRRSAGDGRRIEDGDSRRPWDDVRRLMDPVHGRRSLDPISDRRQHPAVRRSGDDHYRRSRGEGEMDVRDFPIDDRRGRKLIHPEWDAKDQGLDYRDTDVRDDWNHSDRHNDWNARYNNKWRDHEESQDNWGHYRRRPPYDEWSNDWSQDQLRPLYPEDRLELLNEEFSDHNGKRHNDSDAVRHGPPSKGKEAAPQEGSSISKEDKVQKQGDALSDISDDPDDILNQDDEPVEEKQQSVNHVQQNSNQQIYVRSNEFLFEQRRPLLECLGERSLDFEEISDEELEEEARVSKGIIDVLGADWAGLVQETRPRPKRFESPGSAHRRWMSDRIISRLGISSKYAGQQFAAEFVDKHKNIQIQASQFDESISMKVCENEVKEQSEEVEEGKKVEVKPVKLEVENENVLYNVSVALEPVEGVADLKTDVGINLLHSIPALHTAIREAQTMKSSLFLSHHRFKRALSARTDLNLRRELCNFPSKEPLHFTPPLDSKMYETSIQLFYGNMSTAAV